MYWVFDLYTLSYFLEIHAFAAVANRYPAIDLNMTCSADEVQVRRCIFARFECP
jgi:hypothetical protein